MLKIGCHLSSAGGYLAMAETASKIGANVFQFFTRNPRGGSAKPLDEDDVHAFLDYSVANGISCFLAHAPYTLNACAEKASVREFAHLAFREDLEKLQHIPGSLYNFHPGSHVGQGLEQGISLIAETLNDVLTAETSTIVLLETMAGKGTEVGSRFEELRAIIDRVNFPDKMGVCLDTCHVYDAGYDIVGDLDGVLQQFDDILGLDRLKAIHLNDSKNPFLSHKDRHECLGFGSIGTDAFAAIINHPALRDKPFYLETPNDLDGYRHEIELLKFLYIE